MGGLFILAALITLAIGIFVEVLGGVFTNVIALVASGIALVIIYVIVASGCFANVAVAVALVIINVGVNQANVFATFYVTSGVTSIVELVRIYIVTNVSATFNVAGNIASVAINVSGNFANVVTVDNITNCIAYAAVFVRRNLAGSTANAWQTAHSSCLMPGFRTVAFLSITHSQV